MRLWDAETMRAALSGSWASEADGVLYLHDDGTYAGERLSFLFPGTWNAEDRTLSFLTETCRAYVPVYLNGCGELEVDNVPMRRAAESAGEGADGTWWYEAAAMRAELRIADREFWCTITDAGGWFFHTSSGYFENGFLAAAQGVTLSRIRYELCEPLLTLYLNGTGDEGVTFVRQL